MASVTAEALRSRPGSLRGLSAAKGPSSTEATAIALHALHHAGYQNEMALAQILELELSMHNGSGDNSGSGGNTSGSASCGDGGMVELVESSMRDLNELGCWSATDVRQLLALLRKRTDTKRLGTRRTRLGTPSELMEVAQQLGKSTGEVVGWYFYAKRHKDYAQRVSKALAIY
eukprot:COSAG06_NODE_7663_length_2423_cov_4.607143_3_plen_174_part_00